jgi:FkbH-like protein
MDLHWLPKHPDWGAELKQVRELTPEFCAPQLVNLANTCIDFIQTGKIDRQVQKSAESLRPYLNRTKPIRLALIGSSTLAHLTPAIRVAALRRGFMVEIFEGDYGMYHQELADKNSKLYEFMPDVVLLALDAHHVAGGDFPSATESIQLMESCWRLAQNELGATVIQQTILPVFPPMLGNNEHLMENSAANVVANINSQLRSAAAKNGVHLLAVDALAQEAGVRDLYDPSMWHRSKQEIHPAASPIWGEQVGRLLGALRGLSYKCLVLDLDNTLWGGVIGDDGLEGIRLGQGSELGEAYVAFQKYVLRLASRGVILAVCSKNDEINARSPFERHPEMLLRLKDIACFVANWQDKASNLRYIAQTLNIGLDSLVFADDNPFERNLVRQELPMVAVPELPEDPALYIRTIADGGYFEALSLTAEDRRRTQQYQSNAERERLRETVTDMSGYLRGLDMQMIWLPFEPVGLARVTQLINKSNQFNLTTRRYTNEEVSELMRDENCLTLQIRLVDRFGDNGMIAVIIGKRTDEKTLEIDTWLMSCRVLGRQAEEATLNLIVERARMMGMERMVGVYLPTAKNGMVKEHYGRLGFAAIQSSEDGISIWSLDLLDYEPKQTFIQTLEGAIDNRSDLRAAH